MEVEEAIEVFVHAFSFTRGFTHPCEAVRVGPVWVMRDAPRQKGEYRKEEWVAFREEPKTVNAVAREHTRGRFFVCAVIGAGEDPVPVKAGYKGLGYRLLASEGFFVLPLSGFDPSRIGPKPPENPIERVTTPELADRLFAAARFRQILPEHLADPNSPLRQYVAMSGRGMVGWVKSITVEKGAWVSNLFVEPAHRRKGLGTALMARMLADDKAAGVEHSVLLASTTGAMLYPQLGYERIGDLMIFAPPKQNFPNDPKRAR